MNHTYEDFLRMTPRQLDTLVGRRPLTNDYEEWCAEPVQPFNFREAEEATRNRERTATEIQLQEGYQRIVDAALQRRDEMIQAEMLEYYRRNYALEPEPFQDAFMRFMDKEKEPAESVLDQHFM